MPASDVLAYRQAESMPLQQEARVGVLTPKIDRATRACFFKIRNDDMEIRERLKFIGCSPHVQQPAPGCRLQPT